MTDRADLIATPPEATAGVATGVDEWRLVVEIAVPSDSESVVGAAQVGTSTVGRLAWSDITTSVRGLSWLRGSHEPHGRPRIGEMSATLDVRDGALSPLAPLSAYYAPGTLIRVSTVHPTRPQEWAPDPGGYTWLAHFTGLVESWPLATFGNNSDLVVEVTAFETLRDLSEVDENALPGVVGGGDNPLERCQRLLDAAAWRYGAIRTNQAVDIFTLQSTDMSANRLTELYLTADSADCRFRSGRDGRPVLYSIEGSSQDDDLAVFPLAALSAMRYTNPSFVHTRSLIGFDHAEHREDGISAPINANDIEYVDTHFVVYDADSLEVSNDAAYVINDARLVTAGGVQQINEHTASIARYGRRTFARSDLIALGDAVADLLGEVLVNRQGRNTLRADSLTVATSDRGVDTFETMTFADIGVPAILYPPDPTLDPGRPAIAGVLAEFEHFVTPRGPGGVTWSTRCRIDTWQVSNLPAANLPYE